MTAHRINHPGKFNNDDDDSGCNDVGGDVDDDDIDQLDGDDGDNDHNNTCP